MTQSIVRTPNTLCLQAIEMMGANGVAPTPHNYEIFYLYNDGKHAELNRVVGSLVGSGKPIEQGAMENIYANLVAPHAIKDAMGLLSDRLSNQLGNAMALTKRAATSSYDLGGSMSRAAHNLQNLTDPLKVQKVIGSIATAVTRAKIDADSNTADLQATLAEVEELRKEIAEVRKESLTDELTQIGNRRYLDRHLGIAVRKARKEKSQLAVCMIDIDHFKAFNDTHGHAMGDFALKNVAKTIRDAVAGRGVVARFGGEEFAVILPNDQLHDAMEIMERLRKRMSIRTLIDRRSGNDVGKVTASFGIAVLREDDSVTSLMKRADDNLYQAKREGRNRVVGDVDDSASISDITNRIRSITSPDKVFA